MGPCAQVMRQWALCVASTGDHSVELSGNSAGLEVRISSGSSYSRHPLGKQRACLCSDRGQEGLCFWRYPQDWVPSLTCRRIRALDLKVCPFLPKVYLMEEIVSPYMPCLASFHSRLCLYPLTTIASAQPLQFFLLASRRELILIWQLVTVENKT